MFRLRALRSSGKTLEWYRGECEGPKKALTLEELVEVTGE
jgi:hypothetical protein